MGTLQEVAGPNAHLGMVDCAAASFSIAISQEVTCAQYDGFGRMVKLIKPGDSSSVPTQEVAYNDYAVPFTFIAAQKVSTASGDTRHELLQFYDGLGNKIQEKREHLDWGSAFVVTDMQYDGLGRMVVTSQPRTDTGAWASYSAPSTPRYRPTTTTYDALGRVRTVTQPDSSVSTQLYTLGSLGTVTTSYDAKNHARSQESDLLGRLRRVVEYRGNNGNEGGFVAYGTTTYSYDALDRLTQAQDALGNTTTLGYDSLGRKTSMSDPDMGAWSYGYDPNGQLTSQTDARGITTTFMYDALDRLTDTTFSNGDLARRFRYDAGSNGIGRRSSTCVGNIGSCSIAQSWSYDGRGRQTSTTQTVDGAGLSTTMTYESADRMLTQTYPGGEVITTSYDTAGHALSLCSSLGGCFVTNANTSYTALDQPATRQLGNGLTTTWSYNNVLARLNRITTPGVFDRGYSYDAVGNITAIRDYNGNQTQNFSYDHRDRLTRAWTVAGTAQVSSLLPQAMVSRPSERVGREAMAAVRATLIADLGIGLQPAAIRVPGAYARPVTGAGQLATRTAPPSYDDSFGYDVLGNLTSKDGVSQTYGWTATSCVGGQRYKPHAIVSAGTQSFCYDANGNLSSGGGRSLTWNAVNQPTQMVGNGISESYRYDADGARVTRSSGPSGGPSITTRYAFGIYEVEGAITRRYYSLAGQPIAMRDSSTGLHYLYGDHLGSISVSTNATGGAVSSQYFDAWGKRLSGNVAATDRSFTGQYLDDTGLLFYNARYYDPGIARFVSADSIVPGAGSLTVTPHDAVAAAAWSETGAAANPQELNRYSYVNNNPVGAGDPTGHCPMCALAGSLIGGGLAYGIQVYQNTQRGMDLGKAMTTDINVAAVVTGAVAGAVIGGTLGAASAAGITGYTAGSAAQLGALGSATNMAGNVAGQMLASGTVNPTDVAVAGVVGFAAGAAAPLVSSSAALGAAANTAQYLATQTIKGDSITGLGLVTNAASGAVAGKIAGPVTAPKGLKFNLLGDPSFGQRLNESTFRRFNLARANFGRGAASGFIANQNYESRLR